MKTKRARRKVKPIPAGYYSVTPYLACGRSKRGEKAMKEMGG